MINTSLVNTLSPTPVQRQSHSGDLEAIMRLGPLHLPAKCTPLVHHCSTQYQLFLPLRLNILTFPETILLFIDLPCQIYQQSAQLHDHVWWELSGGRNRCQISSCVRFLDRSPNGIDSSKIQHPMNPVSSLGSSWRPTYGRSKMWQFKIGTI